MSERAQDDAAFEHELDQLIDRMNAGRRPSGSGELEMFAETIGQLRELRDISWPDRKYPRQLAANLQAELLPSQPAQTDAAGTARDLPASTPNGRRPERLAQAPDWRELAPPPRRHGWLRSVAGLTAGAAGFAALALVLAVIFGGLGDGGSDNPVAAPPAIPDNADIAFARDVGEFNPDVFTASADGSDMTNLTENDVYDSSPVWSPDGNRIVFTSRRDGGQGLYLMDTSGDDVSRIDTPSAERGMALLPDWSADGTVLAYAQNDGNASSDDPNCCNVMVTRVDGTEIWNLHDALAAQSGGGPVNARGGLPVWSPTEPLLAVVSETDDHHILVIANVTDPNAEIDRYGLAQGNVTFPTWAPNGSLVALGIDSELVVGSPGGVALNTLVDLSSVGIQTIDGLDWSPDGQQIVVAGSTGDREQAAKLVVVDVATAEVHELTSSTGQIVWPQWEPNGQRIGFVRGDGDSLEIVAIEPDGSGEQVLVENIWAGDGSVPFSWRPEQDNESVVFPTPPADPDMTAEPVGSQAPSASPTATTPSLVPSLAPQPTVAPPTNPQIAVVPFELTCDSSAAVSGQQFPAGATVEIQVDGQTTQTIQTGDDGSFTFENLVPVADLIPNCAQRAADGGGQITISATVNGEQVATTKVMLQPSAGSAGLTLDRAVGTCDTLVTASGRNFTPDTPITFSAFRVGSDNGVELSVQPVVTTDGTFVAELPMREIIGNCDPETLPPGGIPYAITARTGPGTKQSNAQADGPSATTSFVFSTTPNVRDVEDLHPEMIDWATTKIREFTDDPDATFEARVTGSGADRLVSLERTVEGNIHDTFELNPHFSAITSAQIMSNTTAAAATNPMSEEEAMELATSIGEQFLPSFDQLTLRESSVVKYILPSLEEDQVLQVTWQLLANDEVWLPTGLGVTIDLDTGRLISWGYGSIPYRGPLEPKVSEQDAREIVEQKIADSPELRGASIAQLELTVWDKSVESTSTEVESATNSELVLAWLVRIDRPGSSNTPDHIAVDALTGELLLMR